MIEKHSTLKGKFKVRRVYKAKSFGIAIITTIIERTLQKNKVL